MNFLNSAILAGLAAAAIPLLIHLLNRRRVAKLDFPSVMFLRDLRKTRLRRIQLLRWLLLAVRTLIVALAVLAFARPTLTGGLFAGFGSRAKTSAILLVDRSGSMALETANGTAAERTIARAREVLSLMNEGDEAALWTYAGAGHARTADFSLNFDRLAEDAADLIEPTGGTDALFALGRADEALERATNLNREAYLIGDLARNGFLESAVSHVQGEPPAVFVIDVAEPGGINLAVGAVTPAEELIAPGIPFTITASVINFTDQPVDRVLVSLFIDGRRIAQAEASLPAGGTDEVSFLGMVDGPGIHTGFVELSADDNPLDNRRYLTIALPEQTRVLLSSHRPSQRLPFRLALEAAGADAAGPTRPERFIIDEVAPEELNTVNLADYGCVIVAGLHDVDPRTLDQLERYIQTGGGVFLAPDFEIDSADFQNRVLERFFGRKLGRLPRLPNPERYFVWEDLDLTHPLFSVYADIGRARIPEIKFFSIFRALDTGPGRALARFSGGQPALLERRLGRGKLILAMTDVAPAFTSLSLHTIFVPLTHRLVEYCAADLSERRADYAIGEPIERPIALGTTRLRGEAILIDPSGNQYQVPIDVRGGAAHAQVGAQFRPGVYEIRIGDRRVDAFALNVDPDESNPERITETELRARLGETRRVSIIDPDEPVEPAVTTVRYGAELRHAVLWAVAALLALEMLLARTRKKDLPKGVGVTAAS